MSKCRTCKFWFRGVVTHVDPESKSWDGSPHPDAGKKIITSPWVRGAGACMAKELDGYIDGGKLVTSGYFGCIRWEHDDGSDKFDHHFVKYAGQESLEQAIAAIKEDTEKFEEEIPTDSTVMVRFFMKDGETWLEYDERVGPASHQLTHVVRPTKPSDLRDHKDKYDEFSNSMYVAELDLLKESSDGIEA